MKRKYLYIILFFAAFSLSASAIFVKLSDAPSTIIAGYRMLISTAVLLPFLLFNTTSRTALRQLSAKQWLLGILAGFFLAAHYALWFESLRFTSVASSTVLVTLQPLFAFIGGYFLFGEKITRQALFGGLLAISGSTLISWQDFQVSGAAFFGDILAFIAAGLITGYFFLGQGLRKQLPLIPYVLIGYGSSSVLLLTYSLLSGYSLIGYSANNWLWFACLALISTVFGQTIFNWLLKWLSTSTISMSIVGEPIGTCVLAYLILGQGVTLQQSIGILVILTGITIFLSKGREKQSSVTKFVSNKEQKAAD
ncbi:DMT family transporter [Sporolactobacillus shoreicorticis]|uniref:DMT family transporter n=1 Tax=Sporolactobacillus shoreicorticis TaxID=1923877 RepID=A0ABW5S8Y5_9BACL|nr:DMT family transporter [Sporolactobacillus shoreicorticis]MCO7126841.1 DMT family transporter [Sporolactobacillus shoreicorticis]